MPMKPPTHRPNGQVYRDERERKRLFQRDRTDKDRQRFYWSARWRTFRDGFLKRHPLCEDCLARGIVTEATEVDHQEEVEDRPDLSLVEENCRAKCKPCHSRKTARTTIAIGKGR